MPVVDASVLVEYVAGSERRRAASGALPPGQSLWAPHLIDAEVGHVLRRSVLANEMTDQAARAAFVDLHGLGLQRVPHTGLVDRVWELRDNVSFYDALYVALAEALELPLVTFDARIARASGVQAEIQVLS